MHRAGQLVAVHSAQLEIPGRQVTVTALPGLVDHHVERAVHGLQVVGDAVQFHRRVHPLGVKVEVAAGLPQHRLGDMGAEDEVVVTGLMAGPAVVLDDLSYQRPLWVPYGEAGAEWFRP